MAHGNGLTGYLCPLHNQGRGRGGGAVADDMTVPVSSSKTWQPLTLNACSLGWWVAPKASTPTFPLGHLSVSVWLVSIHASHALKCLLPLFLLCRHHHHTHAQNLPSPSARKCPAHTSMLVCVMASTSAPKKETLLLTCWLFLDSNCCCQSWQHHRHQKHTQRHQQRTSCQKH